MKNINNFVFRGIETVVVNNSVKHNVSNDGSITLNGTKLWCVWDYTPEQTELVVSTTKIESYSDDEGTYNDFLRNEDLIWVCSVIKEHYLQQASWK